MFVSLSYYIVDRKYELISFIFVKEGAHKAADFRNSPFCVMCCMCERCLESYQVRHCRILACWTDGITVCRRFAPRYTNISVFSVWRKILQTDTFS
jgi:hypothetical protein